MSAAVMWTFVVADSDRIGGSERRLADAIPLLLAAGDEVSVRTLTPPKNRTATLLAAAGAQVTDLRGALCSHPADSRHVVMTFGHRASLITRLRKPRLGSACELWQAQVGLDPGRSRPVRAADRVTRGAVDLVLANSHAAAAHAVDVTGFDRHRVHVIESGLPAEWLRPTPKQPGTRTAAMIGSDRPMKNLAGGIRVFADSSEPGESLVVFTDDASGPRELVARLGLTDRVTVHEHVVVQPSDHAGFAALLQPSLSESLPRVVLEAIAQQTPVAAYDVGDTARWVAATARPGDEAALGLLLRQALDGSAPDPPRPVRGVEEYVTELRALAAASRV